MCSTTSKTFFQHRRMTWAFWLEGVCIPVISTFGLLGKSLRIYDIDILIITNQSFGIKGLQEELKIFSFSLDSSNMNLLNFSFFNKYVLYGVVEIFQETGHFVLYLGFGFFHFSTFSRVFNSRERVLYLGSQQQKGSFGSQPDLHLPPYLFGNFSPFASLFVPFACFFFRYLIIITFSILA